MLLSGFGGNPVSHNQVRLLQANNVISNTTGDCAYLKSAVQAWFKSASVTQIDFGLVNGANMKVLVHWAQLLPVRCDWQRDDGVITYCLSDYEVAQDALCNYWDETATDSSFDPSPDYFAGKLGVRVGGMVEIVSQEIASADFDDGANTAEFIVRAIFNETQTIALTYV